MDPVGADSNRGDAVDITNPELVAMSQIEQLGPAS